MSPEVPPHAPTCQRVGNKADFYGGACGSCAYLLAIGLWWFGSPVAGAPSCLGSVTPRSLEVRVSKHQPPRSAMYSEMT